MWFAYRENQRIDLLFHLTISLRIKHSHIWSGHTENWKNSLSYELQLSHRELKEMAHILLYLYSTFSRLTLSHNSTQSITDQTACFCFTIPAPAFIVHFHHEIQAIFDLCSISHMAFMIQSIIGRQGAGWAADCGDYTCFTAPDLVCLSGWVGSNQCWTRNRGWDCVVCTQGDIFRN